ncbi:MAG TPA: glutathione S-transferase family protein [Gammaproteobacteria bacterium]|jgi:glutathione S-transferase|nr:glutathione S-transferase family protein [Gammaproteobacteria bacterium]
MKLYNADLSPYCARVRIQLKAKNLDAEIADATKFEKFTDFNPIGKIPAMDVDGETLPESQVICDYLEETHPEPSLVPDTPLAFARMSLLSRIGDLYVITGLGALYGQMDPTKRDQAVVDKNMAELNKGLGFLEQYLSGGTYAVGDKLTLADCTLMPFLFFVPKVVPMFGNPEPFKDYPKVRKYFEEIITIPPVSEINAEMEEGLKQMMAARAAK